MSNWINIHDADIEILPEGTEVSIYCGQDEWGSVYAVLTFDQVKELYNKITEPPQEKDNEGN